MSKPKIRKILVSVKCVSAILGPEMGAPILWTPGKMRSFCRKTHVHKIPRFRGGRYFGFWGEGSADFIFMGARIFLRKVGASRCAPNGLATLHKIVAPLGLPPEAIHDIRWLSLALTNL